MQTKLNQNITRDDEWFMGLALQEAKLAFNLDEVPVGAIVVSPHGEIVSRGHNLKESSFRPLDHAEIIALNRAGEKNKSWRLDGYSLYVTLEPCPMCLSGMVHSRIKRLVFGAYDSKGGAISCGFNFYNNGLFNHTFSVTGGIRHFECSKILSDFFRFKRDSRKN